MHNFTNADHNYNHTASQSISLCLRVDYHTNLANDVDGSGNRGKFDGEWSGRRGIAQLDHGDAAVLCHVTHGPKLSMVALPVSIKVAALEAMLLCLLISFLSGVSVAVVFREAKCDCQQA